MSQQQYQSTGHGTVDVPWSQDAVESLRQDRGQSSSKHNQHEQQPQAEKEKEHTGFGHTTHQGHSRRSIKRDLNNI
ncbi:hypothetical protein BD560DRAFT_432223 [Blakeslea trispora]|nr:hypothetical protein BD560DRAFT_432223 [Blakeslea trispora]